MSHALMPHNLRDFCDEGMPVNKVGSGLDIPNPPNIDCPFLWSILWSQIKQENVAKK